MIKPGGAPAKKKRTSRHLMVFGPSAATASLLLQEERDKRNGSPEQTSGQSNFLVFAQPSS